MCGNPELVYDAARDGLEWGEPAVYVIVFMLSLYGFWNDRRTPGRQWWYPPLFILVGGLVVWVMVGGAVDNYREARRERFSSGYETIEGTVEKFVPQPWAGHATESFNVAGNHFSYSDFTSTSGFHQSHSHGGPIAAGVHVRIGHFGNTILHIELCR
jgi:hypothetical protein